MQNSTLGILVVLVGFSACDRDEVAPPIAPDPMGGSEATPSDQTAPTPPQAEGQAQRPSEAAQGENLAEGDKEPVAGRIVNLTTYIVDPGDFIGVTVSDTATVSEVVTDRGFWLGSGPNRVFAIVREDVPRPEQIDINPGQRIRFEGLALSRSAMEDVTGQLEPKTQAIIQQQPGFIAMHWRDVQILENGKKATPRGPDR